MPNIQYVILFILGVIFLFITMGASAQSTTIPKGSIIVDMGIVPQTVENGLKPYGLAYELINIRKVPLIQQKIRMVLTLL